MLGELEPAEVEQVLQEQQIGRLGVAGDGRIYIFPVLYGYDVAFIYAVSQLGLKVRLMREHPGVCFEVEEVESPARWRTVLVHGRYEELWEQAARDAAQRQIASQGVRTVPLSLAPYTGRIETLIVYRIPIAAKTGRFEWDAVMRTLPAPRRS
jgi:nitroimidazol reductase NimA-like FMN-containing flavoprotein (pyridoxamine 5'-phosphate oxidase superfamily)